MVGIVGYGCYWVIDVIYLRYNRFGKVNVISVKYNSTSSDLYVLFEVIDDIHDFLITRATIKSDGETIKFDFCSRRGVHEIFSEYIPKPKQIKGVLFNYKFWNCTTTLQTINLEIILIFSDYNWEDRETTRSWSNLEVQYFT